MDLTRVKDVLEPNGKSGSTITISASTLFNTSSIVTIIRWDGVHSETLPDLYDGARVLTHQQLVHDTVFHVTTLATCVRVDSN